MTDCENTPDVTKRGRGRPKVMDDATLAARIVDLARDVFLEFGFDATTMDVVAKRAGISKMTIYRLFESKLSLFTAIANAHRQTMMDLPRPDEDCSLAESLLAIFRVDIDPEADRCRGAFLHLVFDEARRHPELGRLMHETGPLRSATIAGAVAGAAGRAGTHRHRRCRAYRDHSDAHDVWPDLVRRGWRAALAGARGPQGACSESH